MKKTKIGVVLTSFYLIFSVGIWIYAQACSGMYCGLVLVLPTMPWVFLLEGVIKDSIFVFFILVILNSAIIYSIGLLISLLIRRIKSSRSV